MNGRTMFRLVGFVALLAFGGLGAARPAATMPMSQANDHTWDGGFDRQPAELCSTTAQLGNPLNFIEFPEFVSQTGEQFILQRAGLVNEQGDVFFVSVYGTNQDAVAEYAARTRFCLDVILAAPERTMELQPNQPTDQVQDEAGSSGDAADLSISLQFIGAFLPGATTDRSSFRVDAVNWVAENAPPEPNDADIQALVPGLIEITGEDFTSAADLVEASGNRFLFDFGIDPSINMGVSHRYHLAMASDFAWFSITALSDTSNVRGRLSAPRTVLIPVSVIVPLDGKFTDEGSLSTDEPTSFCMSVIGRADESEYGLWGRVGSDVEWSSDTENPVTEPCTQG